MTIKLTEILIRSNSVKIKHHNRYCCYILLWCVYFMDKAKIDKLRQDMINSFYSNTELSNSEIYEIVENILRKNGLV
jgi:hypothetical protein